MFRAHFWTGTLTKVDIGATLGNSGGLLGGLLGGAARSLLTNAFGQHDSHDIAGFFNMNPGVLDG